MNTRLILLTLFIPLQLSAYAQATTSSAELATAPGMVPNADFELVTSRLDKGGSMYIYVDLEGALESLITNFEPVFKSMQDSTARQLPEIARRIIKSAGLDQLSDIGASVVKLDNGFRRLKTYVHVKKATGLLELGGGAPGKLDGISFVPSDASAAYVANIALQRVPEIAEQIGADIRGSEGRESVQSFFDQGKQKLGADPRALLASTGNECAGWLRMDPTKTISLGPITPPETGAVFMIKVKDQLIFDTLKKIISEAPSIKTSTLNATEGVKSAIVVEVPENPFGFRPVIAQLDQWLAFATSSRELERALTTAASGKDVRTSEVYQKLSAGLPAQTNGMLFAHPSLGKEAARIFTQFTSAFPQAGEATAMWSNQAKQWADFGGMLSVRVNDETGHLNIAQGDVHASQALQSATGGAAIAILAAIAVPNFLEAQVRAKVARTKNDMRSMATGLEAYFVDYNTYPPYTAAKGKTMATTADGTPIAGFVGPNLTTPVAYLTSLFADPFSDVKGQTFGYYSPIPEGKNSGWILFSPGPDTHFNLGWDVYDSKVAQPSKELIGGFTYDPTNGTVSPGDIWRVKQ